MGLRPQREMGGRRRSVSCPGRMRIRESPPTSQGYCPMLRVLRSHLHLSFLV